MKANYQISKEEFDRMVELNGKPKKSTLVIFIVLALLCGLISFSLPQGANASKGLVFLGLALINLFIVITQIPIILQKRTYKTYKLIQSEITLTFTESSLRFLTPSSDMEIKWDQILKWKRNKHFILVYIAKNVYTPIAKKIAQDGFPIDQLEKTLTEKVGNPV